MVHASQFGDDNLDMNKEYSLRTLCKSEGETLITTYLIHTFYEMKFLGSATQCAL